MTKDKGGNNSGPWGKPSGSSGGGNGNYGGGGNRGGKNGGSPNEPADIEAMIRRSQERFRGAFPGKGGDNRKVFIILGLVAVALWLASGIYRVEPEEEGVVLRFGEYHRTEKPGLRYHLPAPLETVFLPPVTRVNSLEIGFRSMRSRSGTESREQSVPEESLMLSGDENIIDITFAVQWRIKDAKNFLFNVRNPEDTVKDVAESVMREVIGKRPLAGALTSAKQDVEDANRELLQSTLDRYESGIQIERVTLKNANPPTQVIDSFRDVQAAKADQERMVNESNAYKNAILPKAEGEAAKLVQDSMAYKAEVTKRSEGEASRFIAVFDEYKTARDITKKRMHLEAMEAILQDMDKVIMDNKGGGVVPYMALPEIKKRNNVAAESTSSKGTN